MTILPEDQRRTIFNGQMIHLNLRSRYFSLAEWENLCGLVTPEMPWGAQIYHGLRVLLGKYRFRYKLLHNAWAAANIQCGMFASPTVCGRAACASQPEQLNFSDMLPGDLYPAVICRDPSWGRPDNVLMASLQQLIDQEKPWWIHQDRFRPEMWGA